MNEQLDAPLQMQLARLEARGRGHLAAAAHRASLVVAWRWTTWAALAGAAGVLGAALWLRTDAVALAAAWLAACAVVAAFAYAMHRRRAQVARGDALALFDRRLALKDRIAASDEFLHRPVRDGFHEAALAEARPWIARALDTPLPAGDDAAPRGARWSVVAAAVVLLAAAVWVARTGDMPVGRSGAQVPAGAALLAAVRRVLPGADPQTGVREAAGAAGGGAAGVRAGGVGAGRATVADVRATGNGTAGGTGAPGDAAGRPGGAARAASSAAGMAGAAGASGDAGRSGAMSPAGAQPGEARGAATTRSRDAADGGAAAGATAGAAATAIPPGQVPAGMPMPPARAGSAPPRPQGAQQGGAQPQTSNRPGSGQKGGTSAQGGNQGPGQGQGSGSGRGVGQDAVKKTRGSSALMLAVPMEDRLIGTPNAGRVSSLARPSTPRAVAVGQVAAQDRGRGVGDAGRILKRPGTRHDDLLVRDFFRLRRGEPLR